MKTHKLNKSLRNKRNLPRTESTSLLQSELTNQSHGSPSVITGPPEHTCEYILDFNKLLTASSVSDAVKTFLKFYFPTDWQRILKEGGKGAMIGTALILNTILIKRLSVSAELYGENDKTGQEHFSNLEAYVIGPLFEELVYRAILPMTTHFTLKLKTNLSDSTIEKISTYGVNTFFAALHAIEAPKAVLPSLAVGLAGVLLQKQYTGLWAGAAAHTVHNYLARGYTQPVHDFIKKLI